MKQKTHSKEDRETYYRKFLRRHPCFDINAKLAEAEALWISETGEAKALKFQQEMGELFRREDQDQTEKAKRVVEWRKATDENDK